MFKKSPPEFLHSGGDLIVVFEAVQRSVYLLDYYRGFIKVFFCDFGIFKLVKEFCHLLPKHFVSPWTALDYNITLERSVYQICLLFDFEKDVIKPFGTLTLPWQTGTSVKTTRLMFNLWSGVSIDLDKSESVYEETRCYYTPEEIFRTYS